MLKFNEILKFYQDWILKETELLNVWVSNSGLYLFYYDDK